MDGAVERSIMKFPIGFFHVIAVPGSLEMRLRPGEKVAEINREPQMRIKPSKCVRVTARLGTSTERSS
jgi:ribosomal protein S4E